MNKIVIMILGAILSLVLGEMRLSAVLICVALAGSLADLVLSDSVRKAIREPTSVFMGAFRRARGISMMP